MLNLPEFVLCSFSQSSSQKAGMLIDYLPANYVDIQSVLVVCAVH